MTVRTPVDLKVLLSAPLQYLKVDTSTFMQILFSPLP